MAAEADQTQTAVEAELRASSATHVRGLVADAQKGDLRALEQLYLLHFDRIYSYLRMSVGNRHDAEDLTNQTFIKMLESLERFVWRQAPFSAWLFRIAHNLAIDHFRAGRRSSRRRTSRIRMPSSRPPRTWPSGRSAARACSR